VHATTIIQGLSKWFSQLDLFSGSGNCEKVEVEQLVVEQSAQISARIAFLISSMPSP